MTTKKTYLVTGGLGFIGLNFIRFFLEKYPSSTLINIDAMKYETASRNLEYLNSYENHKFIKCDISEKSNLDKIFNEYCIDGIVHFAAESHVDTSIINPESFVRTNIIGTFNLLEKSRNYVKEKGLKQHQFRFHHISTDEVYGTLNLDDPSFTEETKYAQLHHTPHQKLHLIIW